MSPRNRPQGWVEHVFRGKDGPPSPIFKEDSGVWLVQGPIWVQTRPLSSLALTQTPDIQLNEPLESGWPGHLTCSVRGACFELMPPIISWMGAALGAPGLDLRACHSSEISLSPRPQDHGTNLTCRVTFPRAGVSTERTLRLSVSYAPQNLTISIFRGNCTSTRGVPSPRLGWEQQPSGHTELGQGEPDPEPLQGSKPGVLELPPVESGHEGEFICRAQHPRGSLRLSLHVSVQSECGRRESTQGGDTWVLGRAEALLTFSSLPIDRPPQLLGPSCSWEDEGLHSVCSSRAHPALSLRWWLGEGLLEGNSSNASFTVTSSSTGPRANSSLSLRGGLSSGLRLSCKTTNVHGAQSATVLLLPGKPELGEGFVTGAVTGAGVAGLLSLCTCLLFLIVKICRKVAPEAAAGEDKPSMLGPLSPVSDELSVHRDPIWPPPHGHISLDDLNDHHAINRLLHLGPHQLSHQVQRPRSHPPLCSPSPLTEPRTTTPVHLTGYQRECPPDSPLDHLPPAVAAPASREEQELHYASLSFHELRPREPRDQEATSTTEYSEIKIRR
ncbi:PREDICTED: sialic acid-binding Ig-like lectin 5 [Ceratotherium simum simum]|uniref:Sialic acid-binding Ig-like lectin 5 n=1 Tax=Ceratotherium simum simum TaxID=73337 RepID=A0ABM1DFJ9_CERSS|nr:PREDICTED: sialic acid-binding Ig-like lectin 5 [Ceratotherium simum simum]